MSRQCCETKSQTNKNKSSSYDMMPVRAAAVQTPSLWGKAGQSRP